MFLHTFIPGPIALHFGSLIVYWYGLFVTLGGIAGFVLIARLAKSIHFPLAHLTNLTFYTVIFGFLGARAFYVLFIEWSYYSTNTGEILKFWQGGISIQGGIIAGAFVVWQYARHFSGKIKNQEVVPLKVVAGESGANAKQTLVDEKIFPFTFWHLADIIVPGVALAQAIGRWGNYFNQELFGKPTDLPWGIPIDVVNRPSVYADARYFHPTFLYESLWNLATCIALVMLFNSIYHAKSPFRHSRADLSTGPAGGNSLKNLSGLVALTYLILYSLGRFLLEFVRIDEVPLWFGVRATQATALLFILFAILVGFGILKKHKVRQT